MWGEVCAQLRCAPWFTGWAVIGQSAAASHAVCTFFSKITCSSRSTNCWGGLCCVTSVLIKQREQSPACSLQFFPLLLREPELPPSPALLWLLSPHQPRTLQLFLLQPCGQLFHLLPNSTGSTAALQHPHPTITLWQLVGFNARICSPVSVTGLVSSAFLSKITWQLSPTPHAISQHTQLFFTMTC